MFGNVGWMELGVLALVGLFVFGPERLPKVAGDLVRQLRALREMARAAAEDLRAEMDPGLAQELSGLADLHPKRFMSTLLDDEVEVPQPRTAPVLQYGERPPFDCDAT